MAPRPPQQGPTFMAGYNSLQVLRGGAFHFLTDYSYLQFYGIFTSFIGKYYFILMTRTGVLHVRALREKLLEIYQIEIYQMSDRAG